MDDTKYEIVANLLVREIADGKFEPLGAFPSDRALMRRFGVSRQTIRLAMRKLEAAGLLYRRPGTGTVLSKSAGKLNRGIGIIVSGGRYSEIFRAICDEIRELTDRSRLRLFVGDASRKSADACARETLAAARKMVAEKVCGVIYQPVQFFDDSVRVNADVVRIFQTANIPVVLIDCDITPSPSRSDCDVVGIDNFDAGRRVAAHLLEAGARGAVFFCEPCAATTVTNRMFGVASMLTSADFAAGHGFSRWTGDVRDAKAVADCLAANPSADAIVCQNDIMAFNLITTLKKLGRSVPDDILVAGFDDVAFAKIPRPSLTSVHQPCKEIATTAYTRLLARMADPKLPPTVFSLSAPLIVRDSTSRPSPPLNRTPPPRVR